VCIVIWHLEYSITGEMYNHEVVSKNPHDRILQLDCPR